MPFSQFRTVYYVLISVALWHMKGLEYNSQRPPLLINEYGRNLQRFVEHIMKVEDRIKRTRLAESLVISVLQINPELKEIENGDQIVWSYLHAISNFKLDVDCPYEVIDTVTHQSKPQPLTYPTSRIRFRYYGKNLQRLVDNVQNIEDEDQKKNYIDMLGSFMKNSGKNWNDDAVSDTQIVEHLKVLSQGKISLTEDEINADIELRQRNVNAPFKKKGKRNHNNNNKYKKNNNRRR